MQQIRQWLSKRQRDGQKQLADEGLKKRYLLVGLGNPGRKYTSNRHNVGFMAVDLLAQKKGIELSRVQHKALVGSGDLAGQAVILAKPQTFMNDSGNAVGPLAAYYRIPPANVLVIYDELDLPLGALRLRPKGGAGGHKGMKSIIQNLSPDFPRLRLGIGRPPGRMEPAAYVLQDFAAQEKERVETLLEDAVEAITSFVRDGIDLAMTQHNRNAGDS